MGLLLLSVTNILLATWPPSTITGTIRDETTSAPLSGVVVSLLDLDRATLTDSAGRYVLPDIPPGTQSMFIRRTGYAPRILHALMPAEGPLEINITLRPEPIILRPIEVQASRSPDGPDGDETLMYPDRRLSIETMRHDPRLSETDVLEATGGGEVALSPESPSGMHIRGGASDQVAYVLDGIPVFSPYHTAGTFSAWNPDALSRVDLTSGPSSLVFPDALSGVVSARTRLPSSRLRTEGATSTTQSRLTVDGPMGGAGAGYLVSLRSAFPGLLGHPPDRSYLNGEGSDWLLKAQLPLVGGRFTVLGVGNENSIGAARTGSTQVEPIRNDLEWNGRSIGGEWTRELQSVTLQIRAWSAMGDAAATWSLSDTVVERLAAMRRDEGLVVTVGRNGPTATVAGIRAQRSWSSYRLRSISGAGPSMALGVQTPVWGAFVRHERALTSEGRFGVSFAGTMALGKVRLSPGAEFRWLPTGSLSVSGRYARQYQFAQSLRNAESVVGNIFPVDLYVGAGHGAAGVPVARSDLGILALEYRRGGRIRLGLQLYGQKWEGLALVAPLTAAPFATAGLARGSGNATGAELQADLTGRWYRVVASYGLQHLRLTYGDTTYVPEYAAPHSINAGVSVFPASSFTIRVGATTVLGRRTTAVEGPFEWEACNLRDRGCEFVGSPGQRAEPLGATPLPGYTRVDLGIRSEHPLRLAGRTGRVAVFGTITNLLDRQNVLTFALDPATGRRKPIIMRPRSPLVVGVDWQF